MAQSNQYPGLNLAPHKHEITSEHAETKVFGFWVFLMSDLITFGLFFATFAIANNQMGYAGGPTAHDLFNINSILAQTVILLVSSFTAGMVGVALKFNRGKPRIAMWFILTLILGASFLYLELRDFAEMWAKGGTPMRSGWLSGFYALVGLHGIHITIGLVWIVVMLLLMTKNGITAMFETRVLIFMLYWHFLDLIWIAIFSFVFLWGLL